MCGCEDVRIANTLSIAWIVAAVIEARFTSLLHTLTDIHTLNTHTHLFLDLPTGSHVLTRGGVQLVVSARPLSRASMSVDIPDSLSKTLPRMSGSVSLENAHT